MKLSYEGIGQWAATFACDDLAEGELVKVSANGTVAACAAGDDFCGMVLSVGRGGDACAVALGGMVTAGSSVGMVIRSSSLPVSSKAASTILVPPASNAPMVMCVPSFLMMIGK